MLKPFFWSEPRTEAQGLTTKTFSSDGPSQQVKGQASRSGGMGPGSIVIVHQSSSYRKLQSPPALRGPTQGEVAGQRVSFWTSVYKASRKWALVPTLFYPGLTSHWTISLRVWEQKCYPDFAVTKTKNISKAVKKPQN